jgi:GNAT superfamily N-acetyltransferase
VAGRSVAKELRVRPAAREDAALLAAMIEELNAHQKEPTGSVTAEAVLRDGFGERPEFAALLAEIGGEPVGYALYHPSWSTEVGEPGFFLYDLYVRDAARGRGAGRALMAALARLAREQGRTFLWWCSKPWNREAQAFYRGVGAIEEPVQAHALLGDAFQALASEADEPSATKG